MISPFQLCFLQSAQATDLFLGFDRAKNHLQAKVFPTSLNMWRSVPWNRRYEWTRRLPQSEKYTSLSLNRSKAYLEGLIKKMKINFTDIANNQTSRVYNSNWLDYIVFKIMPLILPRVIFYPTPSKARGPWYKRELKINFPDFRGSFVVISSPNRWCWSRKVKLLKFWLLLQQSSFRLAFSRSCKKFVQRKSPSYWFNFLVTFQFYLEYIHFLWVLLIFTENRTQCRSLSLGWVFDLCVNTILF
jgi:hypothetical protein